MLVHSFSSHAIDLIDHDLQAGIFLKEIQVLMDKPPVKTIPYFAPLPFRKIAHLPDVIRGADVRLRRDQTAIRILAHPMDIGNHNPVVSISKLPRSRAAGH
jgi:hypothetical protein